MSEITKSSFSSELTPRDDVILAILSLLLLLVIKGIFATILLRTENGKTSNFSYATKQLIELVEEFNFRRMLPARRGSTFRLSSAAVLLIVAAISILGLTFGLEVAVLFMTDPKLVPVYNDQATFRILGPNTPRWGGVKFHMRTSMNRPCIPVNLRRVDQGQTRINSCVDSGSLENKFLLFQKTEEEVEMTVESVLHDYGQDHDVTIGNMSAKFSARVYFTLHDGLQRMMKQTIGTNESQTAMQMMINHNMYLAFMFTAYAKATKDKDMSLERLNNDIAKKFCYEEGPVVKVTEINGTEIMSNSTKYTSTFSGIIPQGSAALRFGQTIFKGSTLIGVAPGDTEDLIENMGMAKVRSVAWEENARTINWLTLIIMVVVAMITLIVLRCILKPVSTVEIADKYVKHAVGADHGRSPVELEAGEKKYIYIGENSSGPGFRRRRGRRGVEIPEEGMDGVGVPEDGKAESDDMSLGEYALTEVSSEEDLYSYGAETGGEWKVRLSEEYASGTHSGSSV